MNKKESELHVLADYLWQKKNVVLKKWEKAAKKNKQLSSLSVLSRKEFYNNIPEFIHQLADKLRGVDTGNSIKQISREHGSQRWSLHLDLREVLEEWRLLYFTLMEMVNSSPEQIFISSDSVKDAQYQLSVSIYDGVKESINQFYEGKSLEAKGRISDLEKTLVNKTEQAKLQGHNLRQASHDLGGSVALIQMHLHLLKKEDLPATSRDLVEKMSEATNNLVNLFKSLLDLFRLEAGDEEVKISEFDVAEVLYTLCMNMQPLAEEKGLKLFGKGDAPLPVRGDWIKVRRIAQNLIMNALKYTRQGYVTIRWEAGPDTHWRLFIKDTGPGLDSSNTAFVTRSEEKPDKKTNDSEGAYTKELESGLQSEGIGLSIVRRLCELLNAAVNVDTESGRGTEFTIVFPAEYPEEKISV